MQQSTGKSPTLPYRLQYQAAADFAQAASLNSKASSPGSEQSLRNRKISESACTPESSRVEPSGTGKQVHLLCKCSQEAQGSVLPQGQYKGYATVCTACQGSQEGTCLAGGLLKLHATQQGGERVASVQLAPAVLA